MRVGKWLSFTGSVAALSLMTLISVAIGVVFKNVPDRLSSTLPIGQYLGVALLVYFGFKTLKVAQPTLMLHDRASISSYNRCGVLMVCQYRFRVAVTVKNTTTKRTWLQDTTSTTLCWVLSSTVCALFTPASHIAGIVQVLQGAKALACFAMANTTATVQGSSILLQCTCLNFSITACMMALRTQSCNVMWKEAGLWLQSYKGYDNADVLCVCGVGSVGHAR